AVTVSECVGWRRPAICGPISSTPGCRRVAISPPPSKRLVMKKLCLLFLLCLTGSVQAKDGERWMGTWASNPTGLPTVTKLGSFTLPVATNVKGTVRYRVRISQGGEQIRLKFSNEYGDKPLTIYAATV